MSHTVLQPPPASWRDNDYRATGFSQAAGGVQERMREALQAYLQPVSHRDSALRNLGVEDRFRALAEEWDEETGHLSSIHQIVMHPAYQQIIGMGPAVVPLLLRDMVRTQAHWFWALRAITGDNPVPPDARGQVDRTVAAWADWGRARGLL